MDEPQQGNVPINPPPIEPTATNTGDRTPTNTAPSVPPTPKEPHALGPIVGVVIIIFAIALGGYYIWSTQIKTGSIGPDISAEEDQTLSSLEAQSDSDSLSTVEADLNATELDTLDQELADIEAEF
jgi:uncharacterized protein HemX